VRVVFYLLIAVNLVYLAWAGWIDSPAPSPPPPPVTRAEPLPALVLVSEDESPAATGTAATDVVSTPASLSAPTPRADSSGRCVSVGPFNDLSQSARAAALLRERGFDPRQRAEEGETWEGFWVYVGGLNSAADEAKVIKALERAGIEDAQAMPESEAGRRVSVGLFTEKARAEKRAQAVKRLGYNPEIVERTQPASVYWVDLDVGSNERTVPTEGLLSLEDTGSRLEIRVCPGSERPPARPTPMPRDARPAATTADAGVPRPG
jgi:hypothetical protein